VAYPSKNVPAGYMGVLCRLYNSSNALQKQAGYFYNDSSCSGIGYNTGPPYTGAHGAYYSYGVSRGYNGNGYDSYYAYKSPFQNY
jgi:hypothetical protein